MQIAEDLGAIRELLEEPSRNEEAPDA